ncbi:MAG: YcjF family protein [Rhodobacteraceae bacterium]|nr:YcjF family protein [Paracoccaceae bacterium]
MNDKTGPVLIDLDGATDAITPAEAPPVPEESALPVAQGRAMESAAMFAARRPSRLARWFWGSLMALLGALVSISAWTFVTGLIAQTPWLGYGVTGLIGLFVLIALMITVRELAVFARLSRVDALHRAASEALVSDNLGEARRVIADLDRLYRGREETRWGRQRLAELGPDQFDASSLLGVAETEVLAPLDAAARQEVEAAARHVATVTALVPMALADVVAALTANIRMIRRVAEVYGGRSGTLGSWRLTRAVMAHLVATGAVAIGDDMLEPILGGGLLSKLSRRFGEGLVNGALTARVGVAAIEVCRPLPFNRTKRPSVRGIISAALGGLFTGGPQNKPAS